MIKKHYVIDASKAEVWKALTDSKEIEGWGGGPAKMEAKEGIDFSLWGGDIHGTNVLVVPEKRLVQDWYGGDWDAPSKVIFTLFEEGGKTVLELEQTEVPKAEFDDIDTGWDFYYLGAIKKYLE